MELRWVMYRLCGGPIDHLIQMVISMSASASRYFLANAQQVTLSQIFLGSAGAGITLD